MWLCQDVTTLQNKWDLYLGLFDKKGNTKLLSELAFLSFHTIEESLRYDMTMSICRLSDPPKSLGNENLSLAYLVENCPDVAGLDLLLTKFRTACEPVSKHRKKRVGHIYLHTAIKPQDHPLPGVNKERTKLNSAISLEYS